ncbi:MBL fold metallo-hydrolase [Marilutibacter spongiae]|uniref:MBL fold metallo-hydrolase n=1 Tax=Marilutibacter spongiae TaxID=2025720 RepID=A0A7W3TPN9_9GAMM|nr:MBL fold metallo-hydrolase [Lysobacter spongiae]MBB1062076.1 MBL fold metallo-hydrolase [Lysobacter spongiae]
MNQEEQLYLREDVYFEPLVNQWYAWPYLLPPVPGARHMVNTHRRIMSSFVKNYRLHIMAVNQPGMAGSEFMDCSEEQVDEIKALVERINAEHADLVELSDAVRELDEILREHTSGESIEHLYERIPGPLKGYVEISMDLEHHPSYRLIESLLYRSRYYKKSLQSVSFGILDEAGQRPFVLSTPRLPAADNLQLPIDYAHPMLDELFRAREFPIPASRVDALFEGLETSGGLSPRDLFTTQAPPQRHQPAGEGVHMAYLGHAGFLIETPEVSILVDPVIAARGESFSDEVLSFSQLPERIDYICITHLHQDHANLETLLQLRYKTDTILVPRNNGGTLADPSLRLLLQQFGFKVHELDDMDEVPVPGGRIVAIPFLGEHGDLNVRSKTAWFYELLGKKIFVGADSSNLDPNLYEHIGREIGEVDIMAIGMECVGAPYTWLYGALHTRLVSKKVKESRRLNGSDYDKARQIADVFKPSQVYLYALGLEPWYKYFMGIDYDENSMQMIETGKMLESCQSLNVPAERLYGKKSVVLA